MLKVSADFQQLCLILDDEKSGFHDIFNLNGLKS
jgi:hypothetical protein